jgi:uncharacterized SAM-binding protein YcdF (DUF218 family)
MFFAKKLVSAFLLPSSLSIGLILAGLLLFWLTRKVVLGRLLALGGFGLLLLASYHPVADALLAPLEGKYPPLFPREVLDRALEQAGRRPGWIVVLGGGHVPDPRVPANAQLGESALFRLVEAIRLQREIPGARLLLSGGLGGSLKHGDVMARVAEGLGLDQDDFVVDRTAWDTEQEASSLSRRIGQAPFLLVTSALHMPRAMALFQRAGVRPIAAPTHHCTLDVPGVSLSELFPSPDALANTDAGVHEYLGFLWSRLRGKI